jgi:acetyl-CoA synthetase
MNRMTLPLADHYGQSELGMLVNCHWGDCLLPGQSPHSLTTTYPIGSMGRAMPGYRCITLSPDEVEIPSGRQQGSQCTGQLAIDIPSSPLYWFQGYLNQPHRTAKCHSKSLQYYLTGDLVHQGQNPDEPNTPVAEPEEDSLFWYISRNDDIITSSGYRIGPADIERCFLKHNRVKDVGVYGVKDPEGLRGEVVPLFHLHHSSSHCFPLGQIIVASVVLHRSFDHDHEEISVTVELQKFIGENLSKHCKPKKILYRTTDLPRTPSGKVQRFKLRDEFHHLHKT